MIYRCRTGTRLWNSRLLAAIRRDPKDGRVNLRIIKNVLWRTVIVVMVFKPIIKKL